MAVETTLDIAGPGQIGDLQTWSVGEAVTPFVVGDPAATGGSISAQVKASNDPDSDSVFTLGRTAVLTTDHGGVADSISGRVQAVNPTGLGSVSLTIDTVLSRLSAERAAQPQWADKANSVFTNRGSDPGQIGDIQGLAVDISRGFIFVQSFIDGLMRTSKFTTDFQFVNEYVWATHSGAQGGMRVAVHPDDGRVYVLDPANPGSGSRIVRFTESLVVQGTIGLSRTYTALAPIPGSAGNQLVVGVIVGGVPQLLITTSTGVSSDSVSLPVGVIPAAIAIHPVTGNFYVGTNVSQAENGSPSVLIYDSSLTLIGEISYAAIHGAVV